MDKNDKKTLKEILSVVQSLFIIEASDEGVPAAAISKILGVSRARVSKVLKYVKKK